MFCKYCGNELPENANFCPKCGKINEEAVNEEAVKEEPELEIVIPSPLDEPAAEPVETEAPQANPLDKERDELGGSILKYAILGLSFGLSCCLSLLGLIFSIVARVKLKEYVSKFGETQGRASVGKGLSIAALIVNIVYNVGWIFYALVFILAFLGELVF